MQEGCSAYKHQEKFSAPNPGFITKQKLYILFFGKSVLSYSAGVLHLLRIPVTRSGRHFPNNYEGAPTVESRRAPNRLSKPLALKSYYILEVLLLRLDKVTVEDSNPSWSFILSLGL